MRNDLFSGFCLAALCAAASCAPSEKKAATEDSPVVAPAAVEAPEPVATNIASPAVTPELSVTGGSVFAAGAGDSMMIATVGAISRLRDAAAIDALAHDAFAKADADKNALLSREEFMAALAYVDARESIAGALGGGGGGGGQSGERGDVFDAASRRTGAVSLDQFAALFELTRVEADRDYDGKLDDAEYGRFRALIAGSAGAN
jgi:hypothetical protein